MTTIVIDQNVGFMAADRRVTSNDGEVIMSCPTKIELIKEGGDQYLVGAAGLEGPAEIFLEWLREGDWDEPPDPIDLDEDDDFSILVLSKKGAWVVDKWMRMIPIHDRWYGIGSGGTIAWAVLKAGCGVDKAMETAIDMDSGSGGGYEVVYLAGDSWSVDT